MKQLILVAKQNNTQLEWQDGEATDLLVFRKDEQFVVDPGRHTRSGKLEEFHWSPRRWEVIEVPEGWRVTKRDETRLHVVKGGRG